MLSLIIFIHKNISATSMCLESLVQQTFSDFECLCILPYSVSEISISLKNLSCRDSRFRLVKLSETCQNKLDGYNTALNQAQGDYVMFLESKDILHPQALSILFDSLRYTHADIVDSPVLYFQDYKKIKTFSKEIPFDKSRLKRRDSALLKSFWQNESHAMTPILEGKMFKTSLLSYLRFQKSLEEEAPYLYIEQLLSVIPSYIYMKYPVYFKRITENEENKILLNKMITLTKRSLYEMEYFILNERITDYSAFLLRRKNTQDFYALLKRFLMLTSEETIHATYDTIVSLIEKLKEQGMMQGLTLTLFQKGILKQFYYKKISTACRLARFFG